MIIELPGSVPNETPEKFSNVWMRILLKLAQCSLIRHRVITLASSGKIRGHKTLRHSPFSHPLISLMQILEACANYRLRGLGRSKALSFSLSIYLSSTLHPRRLRTLCMKFGLHVLTFPNVRASKTPFPNPLERSQPPIDPRNWP